jgi:hypothetical protein
VASEPALAAGLVAKIPEGGNQVAEFVLPAGAKANAQGILGPPGAILFAFIGIYTAATLGTAPLKVRARARLAAQRTGYPPPPPTLGSEGPCARRRRLSPPHLATLPGLRVRRMACPDAR